MDSTKRAALDNLHSEDRGLQNQAFLYIYGEDGQAR